MSESPALTPAALLEALLFAAPQPMTVESLAAAAALPIADTEAALVALESELAQRGVRLQRHKQRIQMVSAPEAAPAIEKLLGLSVNLRMSQAALETLAIIAYAQPVTRPQVESIRGVNSDGVLRTLLAAGMVEEVGRAETVGRPILYGTTFEFLQQFGLEKPEDLPPLQTSPVTTAPAQ